MVIDKEKIRIREFTGSDERGLKAMYFSVNQATVDSGARKLIGRLFPTWARLITLAVLCSQGFLRTAAVATAGVYLIPPIAGIVMSCIHLWFNKDFVQFMSYYSQPGSTLFVAESVSSSSPVPILVGMVGVAHANIKRGGHFKGLRKEGDAEMKRLCVVEGARGCGLGRRLINQVETFCKSYGYKRVMLTTSSIQEVACTHVYPRLGYAQIHYVNSIIGKIYFFAKDI